MVAWAMALGSCGESSESGDQPLPAEVQTSPAAAAEELKRAFVAGDLGNVCALISFEAQSQAGSIAHGTPSTCRRDLVKVRRMIDRGGGWQHSDDLEVTDVTGSGDQRTVTIATGSGWKARLPFLKEAGRWKLHGFFGTSIDHALRVQDRLRAVAFPPSRGAALEATDGAGEPCGPVASGSYPQLSGGCVLRATSKRIPLRILTPFGSFKFGDCDTDYTVRVDGSGTAWIEDWATVGDVDTGCADVAACMTAGTADYQPWKARLTSDGDDGYLLETNMCLQTCAGYFVGTYVARLVRGDGGWRIEPVDGGTSGFAVDGPLRVSAKGFEVGEAG